MLSQDITGLLPLQRNTHFNDALYNSAFCHTRLYYEYRETFRRRLTADSRSHIPIDCGRGSLFKLHGLTWIKILWSAHTCWPYKMPAWERHCQPRLCHVMLAIHKALPHHCCHHRRQLEQGGCWLGKVQIKWGGAWCDHFILTVTISFWHGTAAYVVILFACVGQSGAALSPTGHLFGAFQAVSNDRPWDNYRCSAMFVKQMACWPIGVRVTVAVNSRCTRYRPSTGCHIITK